MPILPENRDRYPKDWHEISRRIRFERGGVELEGFSTTSEHVLTLANFGEVRWRRCYVGQQEAPVLLPRSHSPILLLASWRWPPTDLNAGFVPHIEALSIGDDVYRLAGAQHGNRLMTLTIPAASSHIAVGRPWVLRQKLARNAHLMRRSVADVLKNHRYFRRSNLTSTAVAPAALNESDRPLSLGPILIPPPNRCRGRCGRGQGSCNSCSKAHAAPKSNTGKLLCGHRDHGCKGYVFGTAFVVNRYEGLRAHQSLPVQRGDVHA